MSAKSFTLKLPSVVSNRANVSLGISCDCSRGFREETLRLGEIIVRRGRPGLTVKTVGLIAVGFPAANSLSLIFVRIGYRLNGLPYTIPDSMPGSLDCAARGLQPPGHSVDIICQ